MRANALAGCENGRYVTGAKALPCLVNALKYFLCYDGSIHGFFRGQAIIALAAAAAERLAEIAEHELAAAHVAFAIFQHLVQLGISQLPLLRIMYALVHHALQLPCIPATEEKYAVAWQTVAPGAPGFLIISLNALRNVIVDNVTYVRLVYAHPECYGGDACLHVVALEQILIILPLKVGKSGVVRKCLEPFFPEIWRYAFRFFLPETIYYSRLVAMGLHVFNELLECVFLRAYVIRKIVAIETRLMHGRLPQPERAHYVILHPGNGSGCQSYDRHFGEGIAQHAEVAVIRPELVPPLGNAMGLVNGKKPYLHHFQKRDEIRRREALRGNVKKLLFAAQYFQLLFLYLSFRK